jgi:hypothetical protein
VALLRNACKANVVSCARRNAPGLRREGVLILLARAVAPGRYVCSSASAVRGVPPPKMPTGGCGCSVPRRRVEDHSLLRFVARLVRKDRAAVSLRAVSSKPPLRCTLQLSRMPKRREASKAFVRHMAPTCLCQSTFAVLVLAPAHRVPFRVPGLSGGETDWQGVAGCVHHRCGDAGATCY